MKKLCGMIPALVTPFDKNNNINEKALRQVVRMNLNKGVAGFYTTGSTGEGFLMSVAERKKALEIVRDEVSSGLVIAHVGSTATLEAIELAKHAKKTGADVVASVPPFYYKYSPDEIKQYYRDIADACGMPVLIYNIPGTTGVMINYDTMEDLFKEDFIRGLKFTSKDFYQLERIKTNFPGISVFNGFDEVAAGSFVFGADGGIGSTYNIMGEKFVAIYKAAKSGDFKTANKIQSEINDVIEILLKVGVIRGIKYILKLTGFDCGVPRKPFRQVNDREKEILENMFNKYFK